MILLDTNVISEPLRPSPEACVSEWIDAQPLETLYLSAMTVAELRAGVALMPAGKRRTALHEHMEKRVLPMFVGRVLPFDMACTNAYAELMVRVRKAGGGIETADACIAAVALANGFIVATRDTSPFLTAGLEVINPWLEGEMSGSGGGAE
ncbi:PIN domain-containing protein [Azotobacter vinelandii]